MATKRHTTGVAHAQHAAQGCTTACWGAAEVVGAVTSGKRRCAHRGVRADHATAGGGVAKQSWTCVVDCHVWGQGTTAGQASGSPGQLLPQRRVLRCGLLLRPRRGGERAEAAEGHRNGGAAHRRGRGAHHAGEQAAASAAAVPHRLARLQ